MRARLRALRRRLAVDRDAASRQAATLAPMDLWASVGVAGGYLAMGSEMDPTPLLRRLADAGMTIALPVVVARDAAMIFRRAGRPEDRVPDAAGILAPPPSSLQVTPTLIIAPLLAFDRAGGRLGQGGGYYDRTLAALRRRGPLTVVGLAYAGQEVKRAPMTPFDQPVDAILTEKAYIVV